MSNTVVILIHGKMRSGKDTFGNFIKKNFNKYDSNIPVYIMKFADSLKQECVEHIQPILDIINNRIVEVEKSVSGVPAVDSLSELKTDVNSWYENKNILTRKFLQVIGTELLRGVDSDIWVKKFVKKFSHIIRTVNKNKIVICTDVRFENELYFTDFLSDVDKENLIVYRVKIIREDIMNENKDTVKNHSSENGLPDELFDFVVHNIDLDAVKDSASVFCMEIFKYV